MNCIPKIYRDLRARNQVTLTETTIAFHDVEFKLVDVKSSVSNDDELYLNSPEMRINVPRGLCFIVVDDTVVHVLCGMKKFGYQTDRVYRTMDSTSVTHEVWTEKYNGECFHITAFKYAQNHYIVAGSKYAHFIVPEDAIDQAIEDHYQGQRYQFGVRMLQSMVKQHNIADIVSYVTSEHCTFVAESCALSSPHIVSYHEDVTVFFAITHYPLTGDAYNVHCTPDMTGVVFASLGLHTTEPIKVAVDENKELMQAYTDKKNCEGAVVYCMDVSGNVTFVYKHKSTEYVYWRAVREKMRRRCTTDVLRRRLHELHVRHSDHAMIVNEAVQFNAWCRKNYQGNQWSTVFDKWPYVREIFSNVPGLTRDAAEAWFDKRPSAQIQLIAVGLPACGKTTLLRRIAAEYRGTYIDQDMFAGNAKRYHAAVESHSSDNNVKLLCLGKNHHTQEIRDGMLSSLNPGQRIWISWYHPDDVNGAIDNFRRVCIERAKSLSKADVIIGAFALGYEPLEDDQLTHIAIDVTMTADQQFRYLKEALWENKITPERGHPVYWGIELDDASSTLARIAFKTAADSDDVTGVHCRQPKKLHITLLYQARQEHKAEDALMSIFGQCVKFTVTEYAYDNVAFALLPEGVVRYDDGTAHITMGTKPPASAEASNVMLKNPSKKQKKLGTPLTLSGHIRHFF